MAGSPGKCGEVVAEPAGGPMPLPLNLVVVSWTAGRPRPLRLQAPDIPHPIPLRSAVAGSVLPPLVVLVPRVSDGPPHHCRRCGACALELDRRSYSFRDGVPAHAGEPEFGEVVLSGGSQQVDVFNAALPGYIERPLHQDSAHAATSPALLDRGRSQQRRAAVELEADGTHQPALV